MAENGDVSLNDKEALKKLFVGGLPLSVTDDAFRDYFSGYGEILDCVVIKDSSTKRSRGFGFVTFDSYHSVNTVLQKRPHTFEGRDVEVKRAIPRDHPSPTAHERVKKLFVGGLPKDAKEEDLKEYLENLYGHCGVGSVSKVDFIRDKNTGDLKGFGFIELETEDLADVVVIHDSKPMLLGKQVELKKAQPKEGTTVPGRGGRGGRGGGRGGSRDGGFSQNQGAYNSGQQTYGSSYGTATYSDPYAASSYSDPYGYGQQSYPTQPYGGGYSAYGGYDAYGMSGYGQASTYGPSRGYGAGAGAGRGAGGGRYRPY